MIPRILGILALVALATCINRGSLTFVIDDTLSMGPTIQEVKKASLKIMDIVFSKPTTPIEDIVLVTFNDPSMYSMLSLPSFCTPTGRESGVI